MAERYKRLFSLQENLYTAGSPVVIAAGALLQDTQTGKVLAQIKFRNISGKQIRAVKVSVSAFDVSGKAVQGVPEYQYLDLNAARDAEFGQKQAINLPDTVTRSFAAFCTAVFFADGSSWNAEDDAKWAQLPKQVSVYAKLGSLADQYRRDVSHNVRLIPLEYEDLWFCTCGAVNKSRNLSCCACNTNKSVQFEKLDEDALKERKAAFEKAEAEKAAEKAKAEAKIAEEKAEKHRANLAKAKKVSLISAAAIFTVAAIVLLTIYVIIPSVKYGNAVKLMEAGNYAEAITTFEMVEGYRDSDDKILECETIIMDLQYDAAVTLMNAGRFEDAITAFRAIARHRDSADHILDCKEAILDRDYNFAIELIEEEKYSEAIVVLESLNGYKDSANKILECEYDNAIALMEAGKYNEAISAFEAIDGYEDSANKIIECSTAITVEKLKAASVDDYVVFGTYGGDIQWLVLDKRNDKMLVVSRYGLDCQPYHTKDTSVNWETCSLRGWLNNDFINTAFTADEKAMISMEYVDTYGNETYDQVFLLSGNQVEAYLHSDETRKCEPTFYAVANGAYETQVGGIGIWWLRSGAVINYNGRYDNSFDFDRSDYIVRPAMWIDLGG